MQDAAHHSDPDLGVHTQGSVVDNYTADSINLSPASIEVWVKRHYMACTLPHHWSWDDMIWRRPYDDIVSFLEERFRTTLAETEYYMLMPYLMKLIPDSELYVPFKESPQYLREIKGIMPASFITACAKGIRRANHPIGRAIHTVCKAGRGGD